MKTLLGAGIVAAGLIAASPAFAVDAAQTGADAKLTADAVWKAVGDFCGIGSWHPAVEKCELADKDGAKIRTLTLKGGAGTVVEKLVDWDDANMSYSYQILEPGPLPVANYMSTLSVKGTGAEGVAISWTGRFDASGASDADAQKAIEGVYRGGIDGILAKANGG